MSLIPKIIHYCWFGKKPLPSKAKACIDSWRKYLPDYEIREWNETNFDIHIAPFVYEAYRSKKWAFVSDYARLWILYNFGGVYFDTDIELIKPMDEIVQKGCYMGREFSLYSAGLLINLGLGAAAVKRMVVYEDLLNIYQKMHFVRDDGRLEFKTIVAVVSDYFAKQGVAISSDIVTAKGINIYPPEFFCPMDYVSRKIHISDNTYSIHHFDGSWIRPTKLESIEEPFWKFFHQNNKQIIYRLRNYSIRYSYSISKFISTYLAK